MKKTAIILTAFLLGVIGTGCSDDGEQAVKVANNEISNSESNADMPEGGTASSPDNDSSAAANDSVDSSDNSKTDSDKDQDSSSQAPDNSGTQEQNNVPEEPQANGSEGTYSIDDSDITEIAVKLHEQSCSMTWKYIMSCPYDVDDNDRINDNGYVRIEVDSIETIKAEYRQIFLDDSAIDEKYIEQDGKVYWRDGGRGGNIFYTGTDIIPVSSDDSKAVFTAVSHYADPDTREPMDSRSYDFVIVNQRGVWRVSEFTLPN